jgi:tripartite-type tricarboxylate transporter receptor subunit TctC
VADVPGRSAGLAVPLMMVQVYRPTVRPIGDFVSGYEASGWVGLSAPRNMPIDIFEKLNKEINAALADAPFRAEVINLGALPFATSSTEFSHFIAEFTDKWVKVIRSANIMPE